MNSIVELANNVYSICRLSKVEAKELGDALSSRTWAAKTWSQRATAWLHTEPHDLEVDGKDILYHVNGFENGFKIAGRTLSQMEVAR